MRNNELLPGEIRRLGIKKISLGAGAREYEGYLRADQEESYSPDVVINFNEKWELPKNWFTNIIAEQILEHVVDVPKFINSCHDCLEDGGELEIITPYWAGRWATGDPTHIHLFNKDSLNGWTVWADQYIHLNQKRRFEQRDFRFSFESAGVKEKDLREQGFCRILGMTFILKKVSWR